MKVVGAASRRFVNLREARSYFKTPFRGVLNIAGCKFEPVFMRISIPRLMPTRKK
jgi:hypothetical protein